MSDVEIRPYMFRFIELVYTVGRSNKFYRGYLDQQTFEVFYQYGRIGSPGQWTDPKPHDTLAAGNDTLMKQMRVKMAKGYWTNRSLTITCAKPPNPSVLDRHLRYEYPREAETGVLAIANI